MTPRAPIADNLCSALVTNSFTEVAPSKMTSRLLAVILFFGGLAVAPAEMSAQSWNWTVEPVDYTSKFTALAVDKEGNVHLAYYGGESSELKYAFRARATGKWFNLSLEKQLGNFAVNIALDPAGDPHICYTPGVLKHAFWDGKKWQIQEIDSGHGTVEYNCSMTFARDGTPHLTWYQTRGPGGASFLHIKHAVKKEGVWYAKTVDYDRECGKWNSLVIDSQGLPHVAYSAFPPGDLKYAFSDGKDWHISAVDWAGGGKTRNSTGMGISLKLDPENRFVMSFYEAPINADNTGPGEGVLKLARLIDGKWKIEAIAPVLKSIGWAEFTSDLVFDKQGRPHIRYEDGGAVKHAYWDGSKWRIQIVVQPGSETSLYSSMKIDADDTLYISYKDPVDGSLKVAIGSLAPEAAPKISATKIASEPE